MAFLESSCVRTVLTPSVLDRCNHFSCGNEDLDSFFQNDSVNYSRQLMGKTYAFVDAGSLRDIVCAFTVSNASIFTNYLPNARKKLIGRQLPWEKRDLIYPAVLIGRLGVNSAYKKRHVGSELLDYIKQWFVDPDNKTIAAASFAGKQLLHEPAMNVWVALAFALVFTVGWMPVFLVSLVMLIIWVVVAVILMRRVKKNA